MKQVLQKVKVAVAFKDAGVTGAGTAPTEATLATDSNKKMSLDLSDWVKANQENKGKEFTVTYYAKVNANAVVTEKNNAQLEYGNNPKETTKTTPSEAKTPTYPLDILKRKRVVKISWQVQNLVYIQVQKMQKMEQILLKLQETMEIM